MTTLVQSLGDGVVIARRNLLKVKRVPDLIFFSILSPIMFVLLFGYVFGGSIEIPGMSYREFLMAGIFAQTVMFGASFTGAGLAEDIQKGVIDRFRSLPMARSAVLVGRTTSDLVNNIMVITVMSLTGLAVGWRVHSSFWSAAAGFALLMLFAYAFSWGMAIVGLLVPSPEVFSNASFMFIFPLSFLANTFARTETFPAPLRVFAEWNPVSSITQAVRELFGNTGPQPPTAWPLQHAVLASLLWIAILLAVFVPLAIRQYKRAAAR
ncbi:transport permease protein [Lentzea sp. NBRC 105346]|uniref:ABC transporter permease n=1 Tax=Lentzea sp. NBRC 105346 TaxID=3032205 RepID=UPI00249FC3C2|nr:ABC transporter permease [Lentzea sp. NBRC 105346]GLZ34147.1 transport permease protein [Lentzea sp. NBRC 105346]